MGSVNFTHKTAENAKPKDKPYKLSTGRGFYLLVIPTGGKLWRYDYRLNDKRKTASLGSFPEVSLKEAAEKQAAYKKLVQQGIDPVAEKKRVKLEADAKAADAARTFEVVAREWFSKKCVAWSPRYQQANLVRLEKKLFPVLGSRPISSLGVADYLEAIRKEEERGTITTAHALANMCGQISSYACFSGITTYHVAADLGKVLTPRQRKHHAAITSPVELGHMLRAIDDYPGEPSVCHALRMLPYVFVRSSELCCAAWEEIDMEKGLWTIPAARMKMRLPHVVPLSRQVLEILRSMQEHSGGLRVVFPSSFSKSHCISSVGILNALRRMGYGKEKMTIHGFRTTASTLLNEQGFNRDWIEAQLAHKEPNTVRDAYNRAAYLPDRCKMMQDWADYLDSLREQTKA